MNKLTVNGLNKSYGNYKALNNFSAEFNNGIYGILGRNGAGKTTLFRIIVGLLLADSGSCEMYIDDCKINSKAMQNHIGYLPQEFGMYKYYTVQEVMEELCIIRGIHKRDRKKEVNRLLEVVNLLEARKKKIGTLSGGMRRRVGLAQAMIGSPELLIVDEPTAGVDPEERIRIRQLLNDYAINHIVIISTHIVEDIAHICENVVILERGDTKFNGKIKDLVETARKNLGEKIFLSIEDFQKYAKNNDVISFYREGQAIRAILEKENNADSIKIGLEDAYMWEIKREG